MGLIFDLSNLSTADVENIIRSAAEQGKIRKMIACDEKGNRYDVTDVKCDGEVILLEIKSK